jgi:hypothetical protein
MQGPNDRPYEDQGYDAPYEDTIISSPTQPTDTSRSAEAQKPDNLLTPPFQAASEPPYPLASQVISEQESTLVLPPREKSRREMWIVLSVVGLLLVILIPVATFQILTYVNRSTPIKTLDTFCDALLHENYGTAYSQLSPNIQTHFSENAFAGELSLDKIVACKHGIADEALPRVSTNLELVHTSQGINHDIVFLTKDKNNYWRIDDLQKQA